MYIITNTKEETGYIVADVPQIESVLNISRHTIHNWFSNGKTYKKKGDYIIVKIDELNILKSTRGGRRENSCI